MIVEQLILGAVQGIAEWLPVSSEGLIFLVHTNFFPVEQSAIDILREALFLHLGTFFAALIYFWRDVVRLLRALVSYKTAGDGTRALFRFLIVSTIITAALGIAITKVGGSIISGTIEGYAGWINAGIGALLLITGTLLIVAKRKGNAKRGASNLTFNDGLVLGVVQAFATVPGLSRSGLTVSALLLAQLKEEAALRISFLMSLPIVFIGNIVLNFDRFAELSFEDLVGLGASFVFGLLTIHVLLKVAKKIDFGKFVIFFGLLLIIAAVLV